VQENLNHDPEKGHWEIIKWLLQYIKGNVDDGLVIERDTRGKQLCREYFDSDYVRNLDKHQSTTTYMFMLS